MAREDDVFVVGNVDGVVKRANSECCCHRREFLRALVAVKVVVGETKASTTTNDKANINDISDRVMIVWGSTTHLPAQANPNNVHSCAGSVEPGFNKIGPRQEPLESNVSCQRINVLHRQLDLHSHICLHSSVDGPMYRRYMYNGEHKIQNATEVSSRTTADHLAMEPLNKYGPDRWFIKLVGTDRQPIQEHRDNRTYRENSGLASLSKLLPAQLCTVLMLMYGPI